MNNVTNGLSIDSSLTPTNQDIIITFTPKDDVTSYKYRILKNSSENLTTMNGSLELPNTIYNDYVEINSKEPTNISLTETGVFQIEIITTNINQNTQIINSGNYVIDKEAPQINLNNYKGQMIEYKIGETNFNVLDGVTVFDNYDGNILSNLTTNYDSLDLKHNGIQTLQYTISDQAGNIAIKTLDINVVKSDLDIVHMWQILILVIIIPILICSLIYNRATRLEKRIIKYSVEPIKKYSFSIFDKLIEIYQKIIDFLKPIVSKSVFITKHSKKFDKYVGIVDNFHKDSLELVCSKMVVAVVVLLLAIVAKTFQFKVLSLEEAFIPLILGYLFLDIYYAIKYKQYRNRLENDLLQAIIVMNNSFKSGRSITQAIELVTKELEGPIADEFKLMHMQLQFGLSIDVAFANFAKRINIEEVNYLTASLSILNKTGGNIIKVFSSIEKTLFNKKKLKLELNSLTGSSRIIMYLLSCLPIFLVVIISFVNPSYFITLYTTPMGLIILFIAIVIYISYIVVIRKIMKVRM